MEPGLVVLGVLVALTLAALAFAIVRPRLQAEAALKAAWEAFTNVGDQLGLRVEPTDHGWPRLAGTIDGLEFEIDSDNHIDETLNALLGVRCRLPHALGAPSAALWVGDIAALRTRFGSPRPAGDRNELLDVYTRFEPSASDWWQEPALHDALAALPGAGVWLHDGQLTVLFSRLDAETVRAALAIPGLVRRGVERVTLH